MIGEILLVVWTLFMVFMPRFLPASAAVMLDGVFMLGLVLGVAFLLILTARLRGLRSDHSIIERIKEKKILRAIGRRGKLTAVQASLDTSLSSEESRRILEELAVAGHLEIAFEDGKLLYSFWGHEAP